MVRQDLLDFGISEDIVDEIIRIACWQASSFEYCINYFRGETNIYAESNILLVKIGDFYWKFHTCCNLKKKVIVVRIIPCSKVIQASLNVANADDIKIAFHYHPLKVNYARFHVIYQDI